MSARDDDGPAFPVPPELCQDLTIEEQRGMTLRDYFAAKALCGYWANPELSFRTFDEAAEQMYVVADAMLRARNEK